MKWSETIASTCRYGEIAERIWNDWDIIWEDSEADYQGHASILAYKDGKYCWYEWWYGSCSGCDEWESRGLSDEQIEKEMRDTALWLDSEEELKTWMMMLEGEAPQTKMQAGIPALLDTICGGMRDRVNAIRKHLGLPELEVKEEEEEWQ